MNGHLPFNWLLPQSVIEPLGWVLVHSLWQFTLLAVFAGIARRMLLRNSATLR
jgi:hypothetical protein